jgi:hypothetical protein
MFIDDNFSWDKLIIINYPGGHGGDFLCNLLHKNYDTNYEFHGNEDNKFEWFVHNSFKFGHEQTVIKKLNSLFDVYTSNDVKKYWEKEKQYCDIKVIDRIKTIFTILYDEDPIIFKKNYIQFIRNAAYENYNKKKFITNLHYTKPIKNFSIHEALPKSINFFLTTEKIECVFLFFLLFNIKDKINDNDTKKYFINLLCENAEDFYIKNVFDNMIPIDVGKLFFEKGYEEIAENIFSDTLNKKIVLDKKILNDYKKNNIELFKKIFNIKNAHELTSKELLEAIVKPHPKGERILKCLKQ